MQIITGKTGTNHVTAEDDRALHAATFGTGNFVLDIGSKFSARVETSNNIVLSDGELMMNGTHARIRYGETETVVIENGTTGYNRIDLIVARYKKQSGLESVELAVIKGETTSGAPEPPSCTEGNILEGAELAEMPLYSVKLEGVNVVSITPLFTIVTGMNDVYRKDETEEKIKEEIDGLYDDIKENVSEVPLIKKFLSGNYVLFEADYFMAESSKNCNQYEQTTISGTFNAPKGTSFSITIPISLYGFVMFYGDYLIYGEGTKTYSGNVVRVLNTAATPVLAIMVLHFKKYS